MEKIFDPKVQEYLKTSGVSDKEILKIKYSKVKEHVIKTLDAVKKKIEQESFDVDKMTSYSPSGDDMGADNYFIDFGEIMGKEPMDIEEICSFLRDLKSHIGK